MKKRLLFAMVALMGWVGMSAADYVYTTDARYKLTGENLVLNGDFTEQNLGDISTFGWSQNTTDTPLSTDAWAIATGVGPNGENVLERKDGTSSQLCQIIPLTPEAYYVVSFDIKANANFTSVIEQGKTNSIDVYVNASGTADKTADETHYFKQLATTINVTDQWQTVAFALVPDTAIQTYAVISMEQLPAGTQICNVQVVEAQPVYDLRIAERAQAWAQKLYDEPAFAEGKEALNTSMNQLSQVMANERASENESTMMNAVERLNTALETYLDANTKNIAELFKNIDITSFAKYNRGQIGNQQVINNFKFYGNNWWHSAEADYFQKYILKGNDNDPGSLALYNKYLPKGKYFIAAEVLNGTSGRGSNDWSTVPDLTSTVRGYVNGDTLSAENAVTISGPEYTKVYFIGNLEEGKEFEAGFWWASADRSLIENATPVFMIKNMEVRAFDQSVLDQVNHSQAFESYMAQWNAVMNARKTTYSLLDQPMYPWGQKDLKAAMEIWEPLFSVQYKNWWSDNDGKDTGKATTDELTDWTNYQGVDTASVAERYKKFGLVRGFQDANNALIALNQPFADLKEAIEAAKAERIKGVNANGNRETFKTAIKTAINTLNTTIASTTDDTRVADSTTIANAITELQRAQSTFLTEVENASNVEVLVDIDFSNKMEKVDIYTEDLVTDSTYVVKGAKGEIDFGKNVNLDNTVTNTTKFELGFGQDSTGVLRIGNATATAALPALGASDVVTVSFDVWFGKFSGKSVFVQLRNNAGEQVAGFSYNRYNNAVDYNDFNDAENTGMDIAGIVNKNGIGNVNDLSILADNYKSSFQLVIDYGAKTVQGYINGQEGGKIAMKEMDDNVITTFAMGSSYNNAGRRSWFDNLKITKVSAVPADMEQDITEEYWPEEKPWEENYTTGIREVGNSSVKAPIYSIFGTRLQSIPQKGLYIMNGKKFVVK